MGEEHNFLQDLLETFSSLNDWIKFLIIAGFYGTILGITYLFRRPPDTPKSEPPPVPPPYQPPSFDLQLPNLREEKLMIPHLSLEEQTKAHSETPETPETPEILEMPEKMETPETPETPVNASETPQTPETPETTETSEIQETTVTPEISNKK